MLPLPIPPELPRPDVGRTGAQRYLRGARLRDEHAEAAWALNQLAGYEDESLWPASITCRAQESAMATIRGLVAKRDWPSDSKILPRAALAQLLRKPSSSYGVDEAAGGIASYQPGLTSLPKDKGGEELLNVVDSESLESLSDFEKCLFKAPNDFARALDEISSVGMYRDPSFECPKIYARCIKELIDCGIAGLSSRVKG